MMSTVSNSSFARMVRSSYVTVMIVVSMVFVTLLLNVRELHVAASSVLSASASPYTNTSFEVRTVVGFAPPSDNVPAAGAAASLLTPTSICTGSDGFLYVTEYLSRRIRRIDPVTSFSTVVAGSTVTPFDDGPSNDGVGENGILNHPLLISPLLNNHTSEFVIWDEGFTRLMRMVEMPDGSMLGNVSTLTPTMSVVVMAASRTQPRLFWALASGLIDAVVYLFQCQIQSNASIQWNMVSAFPPLQDIGANKFTMTIDDSDTMYYSMHDPTDLTLPAKSLSIYVVSPNGNVRQLSASQDISCARFYSTSNAVRSLYAHGPDLFVSQLQVGVFRFIDVASDDGTSQFACEGQLLGLSAPEITGAPFEVRDRPAPVPVSMTMDLTATTIFYITNAFSSSNWFLADSTSSYASAVLQLPLRPAANPNPLVVSSLIGPSMRWFNDSDGSGTTTQLWNVLSVTRNRFQDPQCMFYFIDAAGFAEFPYALTGSQPFQMRCLSVTYDVTTISRPFYLPLAPEWSIPDFFDRPLEIGSDGQFYVLLDFGVALLNNVTWTSAVWCGSRNEAIPIDGPCSGVAKFGEVFGMRASASGDTLFVVEMCTVRRIDIGNRNITTIAGQAVSPDLTVCLPYTADGIRMPMGNLALPGQSSGAMAITSDAIFITCASSQICKIDLENQFQTQIFAGAQNEFQVCSEPTDQLRGVARFCSIESIAVDSSGQLFVFDDGTLRVIRLDGWVQTLLGSRDKYSDAQLGYVDGLGSAVRSPGLNRLVSFNIAGADAKFILWHTEHPVIRVVQPHSNCTAGNWVSSNGECIACSIGNYCPAGSIAQNPCPASFFCIDPSQISPCPAGSYCVAGSTQPVTCEQGYYCLPSAPIHLPCAAGRFGAIEGLNSSDCTDICPVGHYCPSSSVLPTPCPALYFGSTTGLSSISCSGVCQVAGYACPAGSSSATSSPCRAGTASNTAPVAECPPCPTGEYSSVIASRSCRQCTAPAILTTRQDDCLTSVSCGPGSFLQLNVSTGSSSNASLLYTCDDCPIGRYSASNSTQTSCLDCPPNTYAPHFGTIQPYSCGTLSGIYCYNGAAHPLPGYFMYVADSATNQVQALPCLSDYCNGDSEQVTTIDNQCGSGRSQDPSNVLCGRCADGNAVSATGDACVGDCNSYRGGVIFGIIIVSWLLVLGLHFLSQRPANSAIVGITVYYAQTSVIIAGDSGYLAGSLDFLNASPQHLFAKPSSSASSSRALCIGPLTTEGQIALQLVVVALFFLLLAVNAAIHALITSSASCASTRLGSWLQVNAPFNVSAYARTTTALYLFIFIKVLVVSLRSFYCVRVGESTRVLYYFPVIDCEAHTYPALTGIMVVILLMLLAALPVLFYLSRRARLKQEMRNISAESQQNGMADNGAPASVTEKLSDSLPSSDADLASSRVPVKQKVSPLAWSLLIEPYSRRYWWFGSVVLLRKLLLVVLDTYLVLHSADRLLAFVVLHTAALMLQLYHVPFSNASENAAETLTLIFIVLLSALMLAHPAQSASDTTYRTTMAVTLLLVTIPCFVCLVLLLLQNIHVVKQLIAKIRQLSAPSNQGNHEQPESEVSKAHAPSNGLSHQPSDAIIELQSRQEL